LNEVGKSELNSVFLEYFLGK